MTEKRKIAVGDLGEFWYGDYKEPFEQLEGGVPGYPLGVLLHDDDGKALCAWCGMTYDNLGNHVNKTHGLKASEYKEEVGLLQGTSLSSEGHRQRNIARMLRRMKAGFVPPITKERLLRGGKHKRRRDPRLTAERANKTGRCYEQVVAVARSLPTVTQATLLRHGITPWVIKRYFGDVDGLRRVVNAPTPPNRHRYTEDQLLKGLHQLASSLGKTPGRSDLGRYGMPDQDTYARRFGSYSEACRRAGLDPNLPQPDGVADQRILVAYASTGNAKTAAGLAHVGTDRVGKTLNRYGWPGLAVPVAERRAWAAEMAQRLSA